MTSLCEHYLRWHNLLFYAKYSADDGQCALKDMCVMTPIERSLSDLGEAKVEFLDGDYRIIKNGQFVRCAVTGKPISFEDLRYWDVEKQEAYISPQAKLQRLGIDVILT